MLYIKIGKKRYPAKISVFTTQKGNQGVRVISEAPIALGFLVVDDNNKTVVDYSDFTHLYRNDGDCKEYTAVNEQIIPTECFKNGAPPSPYDDLSRRISAVNSKVDSITPYTESKTAYIDDTEVFFDIAKDGNISVFMVDGEGQNVPHTFEQINGQIKVSFEKRESLATVTISIQ